MDNICGVCAGDNRDKVVVKKMNDNHSPDVICPHVNITEKYTVSDAGNDLTYQHNESLSG